MVRTDIMHEFSPLCLLVLTGSPASSHTIHILQSIHCQGPLSALLAKITLYHTEIPNWWLGVALSIGGVRL